MAPSPAAAAYTIAPVTPVDEYLAAVAAARDAVRAGALTKAVIAREIAVTADRPIERHVGTLWNIEEARHVAYLPSASGSSELRRCDVLSGFLFATPRSVFEFVGRFDEAYTPCGFEEVDYCTTVRQRARLDCFEVPGVRFEHRFGISAKRPWRRIRYDGRSESLGSIAKRNRSYFLAKWAADSATKARTS